MIEPAGRNAVSGEPGGGDRISRSMRDGARTARDRLAHQSCVGEAFHARRALGSDSVPV
ncbi:hypothetical protein D3C83_53630 [compost metagenome]